MKLCFLTKIEKMFVKEAIEFTKNKINEIDVFHGKATDPFPPEVKHQNYDLLISYISPWIVPKAVLNQTKKWNIISTLVPQNIQGLDALILQYIILQRSLVLLLILWNQQ